MEDEVIEAVEPEQIETEEVEVEQVEQEPTQEPEAEEVTVQIGDAEPEPEEPAAAPDWVKDLRKQNREKEKRIRELEAKIATTTGEAPKPVQLGKKPKLEDHDYDSEKFEAALESWYEQKRSYEAEQEKAKQAEQAQRDAWQAKMELYTKAKAELKVKDYDEAESLAQELFNVTQQGIVVQGADNPALVIYALGKNPKKAKELSDIKDPVKFAFAVAKLEKDLKVTSKKPAPPPEKTLTGTARVSGSVDSTLDRLRAEAEKTGNYTKVMQYKRTKAQK
jgi:hypothetical protein